MPHPKTLRYLLLDFESTGTDPIHDEIWECAVIALDSDWRELKAFTSLSRPTQHGFELVAGRPEVTRLHSKSGLYSDLVNTPDELTPTLANIEDYLLQIIDEWAEPGVLVSLAGSGVSHFDKPVIDAQMPRLALRLTYYSIDCGPARHQYMEATGHDIVTPLPEKVHRAEDDIRDDLRHIRAFRDLYREHGMRYTAEHPLDRALSGLAMVDAFHQYEVIVTPEGELHTVEQAEAIQTLLRSSEPSDVILGLLDVASDLLRRTAAAEGTTTGAVVDGSRNQYLAALAVSLKSDTSSRDCA